MELTEQDKKMIEGLKRKRDAWPQIRWIILSGVISVPIIYFSGAFNLELLILLAIIVYFLSSSLGSWNGRPEICLLLKLIENQTEDKKSF